MKGLTRRSTRGGKCRSPVAKRGTLRSATGGKEACYSRLFAKMCVNAQAKGNLLTKSGSSSQIPYGVWAYRLMLNGIFVKGQVFATKPEAGGPWMGHKLPK